MRVIPRNHGHALGYLRQTRLLVGQSDGAKNATRLTPARENQRGPRHFARARIIFHAVSDTPAGLRAGMVIVFGRATEGLGLGVVGFGVMPSAVRAWFNRL